MELDVHTKMTKAIKAVQEAAKLLNPPVVLSREQAIDFLYNLKLERVEIRCYPD